MFQVDHHRIEGFFPAIANVRGPQLALAGGGTEAAIASDAGQSNRAKKRQKKQEKEAGFETVRDGVTMIIMQLSFITR